MRRIHLISALVLGFALVACSDDDGGVNNNNNNNNNTAADCGDGVVEGTEACDGTDLDGADCTTVTGGFTGGTLACTATCTFDTGACTGGQNCGNDLIEGAELCDGTDLGGEDCTTIAGTFTGGTLACNASCTGYVTTACTEQVGEWVCDQAFYGTDDGCDCGCGIVDPDCADATVASCEYCGDAGSCAEGAECPANINATNNAICDPVVCGDDQIGPGEDCEGTDLGGATCFDLGFASGDLACTAGTCLFDTDACVLNTCGDGIIQGNEGCDGANLGGNDCTLYGFASGALTCTDYCQYDWSACTPATCGDGNVGGFESCDSTNLGEIAGAACADLGVGWTGGTPTCQAGCANFDFSTCTGGTAPNGWTCPPAWYGDGACHCGCGIADSDCADATVDSCAVCNSAGGCAPYLNAGCPGWIDPANNAQCISPTCGDGERNALEACEGADLNDVTCIDLGFTGGTLACANDCWFNTDACTGWAVCGDGEIAGMERCEGDDLGGETCVSLGFGGGTLACSAACGFDTTGCTVPAEWLCPANYFAANDGCDCGCGILDPDCTDATLASCQYCNDEGSCSTAVCAGNTEIDPAANYQCL